MSGPMLLAFGLWMLLTADLSVLNVIIGLAGAAGVSYLQSYRFSAVQFLQLAGLTILNIPRAVGETFLLIFLPHRYEEYKNHDLKNTDDAWSVFVQIFIITFTPLTLVTRSKTDGTIRIHVVSRKGRS